MLLTPIITKQKPIGAIKQSMIGAYWRGLDLTDATGGGRTLTNNGVVTFSAGALPGEGYAIIDAGLGQSLTRALDAVVKVIDHDVTIWCWAVITSGQPTLWWQGNLDVDDGAILKINGIDFPQAVISNSTDAQSATSIGIAVSASKHLYVYRYVAATRVLNLFVDNTKFADGTLPGSGVLAMTAPFFIGASGFGSTGASNIGSLGIAQAAFSDADILAQLWNDGAGTPFNSFPAS